MGQNVTFVLKEPNGENETLLFCMVYITRQLRFKFSTGKKIHPIDWSDSKQEVKKGNIHYKALNHLLKQIKAEFETLILDAALRKIPITKDYLSSNHIYQNNTKQTKNLFFEIFDKFLHNQKLQFTQSYVNKYVLLKTNLKKYTDLHKINITFDSFTTDFFISYKAFLINDVGYLNTTANRAIKYLKTFLNYAFTNGYNTNANYQKVKTPNETQKDIVALTETELKAIEDVKGLPQYLGNTRDLFLLLCYTGVRYSDLKKFDSNQIINGFVTINTTKTKQVIKIPIHNRLAALLANYTVNNIIKLHLISNPKLNKYLKDLGQFAGLNDVQIITQHKGTQAIQTKYKRWELLVTHTGRRTFITQSLHKGMPAEQVMKVTGHKSGNSFKRYQSFADEQILLSIKAWDK